MRAALWRCITLARFEPESLSTLLRHASISKQLIKLTPQSLPVSRQACGHAALDFLRINDHRCKLLRQKLQIKIPDIHTVTRQFEICHQIHDLRVMRYCENGLIYQMRKHYPVKSTRNNIIHPRHRCQQIVRRFDRMLDAVL